MRSLFIASLFVILGVTSIHAAPIDKVEEGRVPLEELDQETVDYIRELLERNRK